MAPSRARPILWSMQPISQPGAQPLRVVVAGAGVAGLETLVALRGLAGDRVQAVLVAPDEAFTLRALTVLEPFGLGASRRYPLAELVADLGAEWHRDAVARVETDRHAVTLRSGTELRYDALVLAVGALPYPAYDHGAVFDRARHPQAFDALVDDVRCGAAESVAVVVPHGITWSLPAYELALMLAGLGRAGTRPNPGITVVTAEPEPLAAFGPAAGVMVRDELRAAGVDLVCGVAARVPSARIVELAHGPRLRVDRIAHLPLLAGPRVAGVPYDAAGFIRVAADLSVDGESDLYAIGDGTTAPVKQGGLAAQQADAVAERLAHRAGAEHAPRPYAPALRALLRTERGPRYLRAEPPGGEGECLVSDQPLWWPPSKVASRWLTPWLAARDLQAPAPPAPRVLSSGGISRGSLFALSPSRP